MSFDTTAAVPGRKHKPPKTKLTAPGAKALANIGEDSSDFYLWGAAAIGAEINRTEKQIYHLYYSHALDGAVRKVNGSLVGSRNKLHQLLGG